MMWMNEKTFHIGIIILLFVFLLVILIYMVGGVDHVSEKCIEPMNAQTKICHEVRP